MSLGKKERKRRAIRRAAASCGLSGLYFYYGMTYLRDRYTVCLKCSSKLDESSQSLIRNTGALKKMLQSYDGPVFFSDENMVFDEIDDLKKYLLVKKLSGV